MVSQTTPLVRVIRTHKLKGELSAYWAYSVNREYRVLFRFLSS